MIGRIQTSRLNLPMGAILLLGLALRLWGIAFGLPYVYHADEGVPVTIALRILQTGNFNPGFFHWSSLLFYLNAAVYFMYFLFGRMAGRFASPADLKVPTIESIAVGKVFLPEEFLIGRGLTVLVGTLTILAVYVICRKVGAAKWVGWVAALLLAVETIDVRNSQLIRPDCFVVFLELITLWFCLDILHDPRLRNYVGAGIAAGLATSFKYNAALVCLPILIVHLYCFGWRGLLRREVYLSAFASISAFLMTTPYALLDFSTFWRIGPLQAAAIYASGHPGAEGDTFRWYLDFFWKNLGLVAIFAIAEIALSLFRGERRAIVLLSFPIAYYALVNLYIVHFDETGLPIIPFLIIFASLFLRRVYNIFSTRFVQTMRWRIVFAAGALMLAVPLLFSTAIYNIRLLQRDARETAREWIDVNLPPGSRVALEPYAPYVERNRFTVEGTRGMIEHPPDWYVQNGYEYLLFSSGSYQRFYEEPSLYSKFVAQYNAFFNTLPLVKEFNEGGYQIRIYKTDAAPLPSVREATRWGFDAPWLELVGYDWRAPTLTLYWRTLEAQREPLQLMVRLLGPSDQSLGRYTQPLFSRVAPNSTWLEGISRETVTFSPPSNPGLYRVELSLVSEGLGHIPVLSSEDQVVSDKIYLESLKFPVVPPSSAELQRAHPMNVRFDHGIALLGYSLESARILLYWQSHLRVGKNYTVFVHVLGMDGKIRAQIDREPFSGAYPTSIWDAGEIVRDIYDMPHDLGPGAYSIEVGMYEYPSLVRLTITDSNGKNLGDHLILPDQWQETK